MIEISIKPAGPTTGLLGYKSVVESETSVCFGSTVFRV